MLSEMLDQFWVQFLVFVQKGCTEQGTWTAHVVKKWKGEVSSTGGRPPKCGQNVSKIDREWDVMQKNNWMTWLFQGSYSCAHSLHNLHALKRKKTVNGSRMRHNYANQKTIEKVSFDTQFRITFWAMLHDVWTFWVLGVLFYEKKDVAKINAFSENLGWVSTRGGGVRNVVFHPPRGE